MATFRDWLGKASPWVAWLLAAIFAAAGIAKLLNFSDFLRVVRGYGYFSTEWVGPLTFVLISLEIAIAITLLVPSTRRLGAAMAALCLAFFLFFVGDALHRGLAVECGCFSFLQNRTIGVGLLAQDLALLGLALLLVFRPGARSSTGSPIARTLNSH